MASRRTARRARDGASSRRSRARRSAARSRSPASPSRVPALRSPTASRRPRPSSPSAETGADMHGFWNPASSQALLLLVKTAAGFVCLTATTYYLCAIWCARDFFRSAPARPFAFAPPITILKPLRGLDPEAYENFASFCRQRYPRFQVIFGAAEPDDPALAVARRVAADHPEVDIRIVAGMAKPTANPKVGCLAGMLPEAAHPFILVSDSDIRVEPDFLSR